MEEDCLICNHKIFDKKDLREVKQARALDTLISSAKERGDDRMIKVFSDVKLPFRIHATCGKQFCRKNSIKADLKRSHPKENEIKNEPISSKLRKNALYFSPKDECFFCSEKLVDQTKLPKHRRREVSAFMTLSLEKLIAKFHDCSSEFVKSVKERYERVTAYCSDMPSAECKYHRDCYSCFLKNGCKISERNGKSGRPIDQSKNHAFEKLIQYLEESDECQYLLSELQEIMDSFLTCPIEIYGTQYLKQRLKSHYGENVIVTELNGRSAIVTFKEQAHTFLREKWSENKSKKDEKKMIIEMAASYIRDSIRSKPFSLDTYPSITSLSYDNLMEDIPEELQWFLNGVIKSKNNENDTFKRRKCAIGHSFMSSCRPRSFLSPLLLSIAIYVHKRHESRELIDILSSLGFGENYDEVSRFIKCILADPELNNKIADVSSDAFVQFVFDNADWNTRNTTGNDTWHVMGGLAAVSGQRDKQNLIEIKRTQVLNDSISDHFILIEDIPSGRFKESLNGVEVRSLPSLCLSKKGCDMLDLDNIWLTSQILQLKNSKSLSPGWTGFMKDHFSSKLREPDELIILPFALGKPSDENTIFSCLKYARENSKTKSFYVTFDQPLYSKAINLISSFPQLFPNGLVKLGEFHTIMSYLGCIGNIMAGTGLDILWKTVYAKDSIVHMMNGHAYSRSLQAHLTTSAALHFMMMTKNDNLNNTHIFEKVVNQYEKDKSICHPDDLDRIRSIIEEIKSETRSLNTTSALWIQYLELVSILKLFISSIRLGDIDTYQYCLMKMIPVFHACGHLNYAKSTRFYLQELINCKTWMEEEEYNNFFEEGRFVIRRIEGRWGGNEADKVIEQDLMRLIKSKGGLTRGRGISNNTMQQFTNALPVTIPMCKSLEEFCRVHSNSSEQHKDLRLVSKQTLAKHIALFVDWFKQHPPFPNDSNKLTNISNGEIAGENVNCFKAFEIGMKISDSLTDKTFGNLKLKRNDKVVTMVSGRNTLVCRERTVEINPDLLFQRICCVIENRNEMEEYLRYELCQQPPSIFKDGHMRKNNKSDLASILTSLSTPVAFKGTQVVIDGGHLLHTGCEWPKEFTFKDICYRYLNFCSSLGGKVEVIFDGYSSSNSTKVSEQRRRAEGKSSKSYDFNLEMTPQTTKENFLSNKSNKSKLISFIRTILHQHGIVTQQADGDADYLIAKTAFELSKIDETLCLAKDTDILIMLTEWANESTELYFGSTKKFVHNVKGLITSLPSDIKEMLTVIHGISDNDTTSGIFKKTKRTIFNMINSDPKAFNYLKRLSHRNLTNDEVATIGEMFLIALYKGKSKTNTKSLDRLRYELYMRTVANAKMSSKVELKALPPTSEAARQHSFRAYLTIQQWKGNINLDPQNWGWEKRDDGFRPVYSKKEPVPDKLSKLISCACTKGCKTRCTCRQFGLNCSVLCSGCNGTDCTNKTECLDEFHE